VKRLHFLEPAVAFVVAVGLVHYPSNVHAAIVDYLIAVALVLPVTSHSIEAKFVDVEISDEISVTFVAKLAGMALDTVNSMEFDYLRPVAVYTLVAWEQFVEYAAEELRKDEGAAFAYLLHSREPH